MGCCSCEFCVRWGAVLAVASALMLGGVQLWLREKSYVFSADEVASISRSALEATRGKASNISCSYSRV